ncbi:MAG TPA: hypothetical protein VLA66_09250, partial [Thermoanaerobaculia bacterium]|nr:hypothetical protein [Thermoanaerobaculia bacterium]
AELVYYSIAGMETGLAAALVAGYLAAAGGRRWWLAGTLAGALLLVRPEAVLVPVLHLALSFAPPASGREARRLRRGLGLAFVALAAVTAWRLASFGVPWPNTFVAKPPGAPADLVGRLAALLAAGNVNLPLPYTGLGLLAVAPLGWLALRRSARELADAAAAVALTGVVFAIYAPADWTETGRFFAPWVPAAALLGVRGVFVAAGRLLGSRGPRPARAVAAAIVLAAVVGGTWRSLDLFGPPRTERRPGYVTVSETLLPTVEHLARTLPRDATLASRRLGALGYFTELAIFDYSNGLTDAAVARLVRANGGDLGTPRHPLLAELWRERAPEYVLEDLDVVADWLERGEQPQAFEIHGVPYRLARTFPLGDGRSRWALLARAGAPLPPPLPERSEP